MKIQISEFILGLALLRDIVSAHTSLKTPASREGGKETVEDPKNTIGCAKPGPGPVTNVKAGAEIPVEYYRNNHVGGFVRWSIIKKGEPETRENFDKNVFHYMCRESGPDCKPRGNEPFSLYEKPYDNVPDFTLICGGTIRIPEYLDDGDYVLQFTNFGTGHSYNDPAKATATYRSCADLKVSGGSSKKPRPKCPTFTGGDRATIAQKMPSNQCAYYYTNYIPDFIYEEKDKSKIAGNYKYGRPKEIDDCGGSNGNLNGGNSTSTATALAPPGTVHGAVPVTSMAPAASIPATSAPPTTK